MTKRLLAFLLSTVMVLSMLPVSIMAEDAEPLSTAQQHTKYETLAEHDSNKHVCEHCVSADETVTTVPTWTAWGDDSTEKNLPTAAGHYYLTRDMDVQKVDLTADVVLCLNGKTVTCVGGYNTANDRFYYLKGTGSITITDCTATGEGDSYKAGKFTGASASGIMSDGGTTGGAINIYDGIFTENWRNSSGGTLAVQGKTKLNIYGGQFVGNSTNNSGAVIYLGSVNNTAHIEGALFKDNHATGTAAVIHSNYGAKITIKDTLMTGNYAATAGVIYSSGALTLENVQITGNRTVSGDYGAVTLVKNNAKLVTLKGNTQITGNTYGDETATEQRNLYLADPATKIAVDGLEATAKIGVSAAADVALTDTLTDAEAVKDYFVSDNDAYMIAVESDKLILTIKVPEPKHSDADHVCEHCEATITWTPWGDDDSEKNLPTAAGHYYLTRDMDVQKVDLTEDVVLCLNGKTVTCAGTYNSASDRFYYLKSAGSITITDCTATGEGDDYKAGKFTGASASGIMSDGGTTGGAINIYDGIFTENWRNSSGGTLAVQGKTKLNIYGGQFVGNSTNNSGAVIYLGSVNNTAHIEGALFKDNHATGTAAVIHSNYGAKITIKDTLMTGNYAATAGVIYSSGALTLENVQITGNRTVSGDYGAVTLVKNNAKLVTLKGNTQITGNTYGDENATEQRNLYLADPATKIAVDGLEATAKIGVSAAKDTVLTDALTDAEAVKSYFAADNADLAVTIKDGKLVLADATPVIPDHPHNLCGDSACTDHEELDFKNWNETDSLPASGNISLQTDVTLTTQVTVEGKLNICLNGHTITVNAENTRAFALSNGDELNITDCKTTGKITGGSCKYGGAIQLARGSVFNLFGGSITGNTALTEEGGAVYIGGGNDDVKAGGIFNMYGGWISDNHARQGAAIRLTNPSGAGTEAQFNMYGGKITGNVADTNGSVIYAANAIVNIMGGEISGNSAGTNGTIYAGNGIKLNISGGTITGNMAGNGAGVFIYANDAIVTLSGDVSILGNTAGGKANNVFLNGDAIVTLGELFQTARIGLGVSAGNRAISTETNTDCSANFVSDSTYKKITYQDEKLYITATADHHHCICAAGSKGCDHTVKAWQAWDNATALPTTEGNFYLTEDVVISDAAIFTQKTNICLNGHTVSVKEGKANVRIIGVSADAVVGITDCQGTGKLTGGNRTYGAAVNIAKNGVFNLYGGTITGNKSVVAGQSYGTVYVGDEGAVFNLYGGTISGNETDCGGAVYGASKTFIHIYGGTISGNTAASGGALYGNKNTIHIDGGTISGNTVSKTGGAIYATGCETNIEYATIEANRSAGSGGALYITGVASKLNVTSTTFKDNISDGYAGGAILAQSKDTVVTITDSAFIGNSVASNGGAIYTSYDTVLNVDSTTFTGNTAEKGACIYAERTEIHLGKVTMEKNIATTTKASPTLRAAGVYVAGGNLTVDGAIIRDNYGMASGSKIGCTGVAISTGYSDETVTAADGSTQKVRHYSTITFNSGVVSGNLASSGAIYLGSKTVFTLNGGEIKNNSGSSEGGGFYVNNDCVFTMNGGTISGNTAKLNGGGILAVRATLNLKGGSITGNTSVKSGGGLHAPGTKVNLSGTWVTYNTAESGYGGGICTGVSKANGVTYAPTIIMTGGSVSNNTSKNGGGILLQGNDKSSMIMYGGTVANNESKGDGGGIYISTKCHFTMEGGKIYGNVAKGRGGAVNHLRSTGVYTGGEIYENYAGNTAGAIQAYNTGTDVSVKNMVFRNNEAARFGGTFQMNGTAKLYLENVEIIGSKCETAGALYVSNSHYFEAVNLKITDCHATKNGGAMYLGNDATVRIDGLTVENCTAAEKGGAIYCRSANTIITDATFIGNESVDRGGAISLYRPTLQGVAGSSNYKVGFVLENAVFRNNKTAGFGGAMTVDSGFKCTMTNVIMENNTATEKGAALHAVGETTINGLVATGNVAENGGYAVYIADSEYDGQSFVHGMMRFGGDMIVKDNQGGDMYMGEQTTASVLNGTVGENTEMHITLASGLLTNKLFGAYNYEGGNLVYTVTYGDRSLTEPEYEEKIPEETQPEETTVAAEPAEAGEDNTLLYAAIGGIAAVIVLAAVILVVIKKKSGSKAGKE